MERWVLFVFTGLGGGERVGCVLDRDWMERLGWKRLLLFPPLDHTASLRDSLLLYLPRSPFLFFSVPRLSISLILSFRCGGIIGDDLRDWRIKPYEG